jgi:2-polyprenyl-3-methyl-5-hydroxy-6-metoxy-1,4-benzoquinol methylase
MNNVTNIFRNFWDQDSLYDAMHKRVLTNCSLEGITDPIIQQNNWDEHKIYNFVKFHVDRLDLNSKDTILDFGCGVGRLSKQLLKMNFRVKAIDVSAKMIEFAKIYIGDLYKNDIEYFITDGFGCGDVKEQSCDAVISHITFQHMTSLNMIKQNMLDINRVLKIGGKINIQHYLGGPTKEEDCGGFFGLNLGFEKLINMWESTGFELYHTELKPVIYNKNHLIVYAKKTG